MQKVAVNRAICDICGEILESKSTHDLRTCSCGNLQVDGGHDYIRRNFMTKKWHDLSVYEEEE